MKLYMYGGVLIALALAFCLFGWRMHHAGYAAGEAAGNAKIAALTTAYVQASAKAETDAREKEQASVAAVVAIDAQHAQEIEHAKQDADAVIAGLRTGALRLREQWRGCEATAGVRKTSSSPAEPDAAARQRSEGARDLVRIAAEADAQIRALQAIVKLDRQ